MSVAQESIPAVAEVPAPAIETMGLTKMYGNLTALSDLNLSVPAGSVFALVGPNGAGKTTAFSILATMLQPTAGVARIFGEDPINDPMSVRGLMGYMPDFFGVYDDVRVGEYLDFFAAAYKVPVVRRAGLISDLLELVDLGHKREDFVESLSRGMKQRLGLARALIHDPALLILDEPASGLDPRARVELREMILELKSMNKTVLISSHILSELEEVCTDIGILEAGKLLVQGPPSQMLAEARPVLAYSMRLADGYDPDKVLKTLSEDPSVIDAALVEGRIEITISGDDNEASDLLGRLIKKRLRIVEFTQTKASLEEIFMKTTKGIVQ